MNLSIVTLIVGHAGEETVERLFILLRFDDYADGWHAVEVWPNPVEPALWLVDDEPTFIRADRIWGSTEAIRTVGRVNRVTLSVSDPSAMRRASEVGG